MTTSRSENSRTPTEEKWIRAVLAAEEQQRRAREEQNQDRDPASEREDANLEGHEEIGHPTC